MRRIIVVASTLVFVAIAALYLLVVRGADGSAARATGGAPPSVTDASPKSESRARTAAPGTPMRNGSGLAIPSGGSLHGRRADAPTAPSVEAEPPPDAPPRPRPTPLYLQLREQVLDTETWVAECNERALKAGKKLDGLAAFWFELVRDGDKVVVSATGVEYSVLEDPASTGCMRETANKMTFDKLPDGVKSVKAYRKVTMKDGVLMENWMSYYVTDPPTPTSYDSDPSQATPPIK